ADSINACMVPCDWVRLKSLPRVNISGLFDSQMLSQRKSFRGKMYPNNSLSPGWKAAKKPYLRDGSTRKLLTKPERGTFFTVRRSAGQANSRPDVSPLRRPRVSEASMTVTAF